MVYVDVPGPAHYAYLVVLGNFCFSPIVDTHILLVPLKNDPHTREGLTKEQNSPEQ
jgi:hypothetical protein